jgi:transglutaminase-like putative cysteine protease
MLPLTLALAALAAPPESRTFTFTYSAEIAGLPAGKPVRIWTPVPPSNAEQTVEVLDRTAPGTTKLTREGEYGNNLWYIETTPDASGTVRLTGRYKVTRLAVTPENAVGGDAERFLKPDALVPVDGKPLRLIRGKDLPPEAVAKVRAMFDIVFDHMTYSKEGTGWGRGDASWACDSRTGNCSDFHSLFASLARSQKLPTLFEIGFGLPVTKGKGEIGGYHCWAKVKVGEKWLPVDISEPSKLGAKRDDYFAKLPPNRVSFSVGRDLMLEPRQAGGPVNFLVYPYVEVDGKPLPSDKVKGKFEFADE